MTIPSSPREYFEMLKNAVIDGDHAEEQAAKRMLATFTRIHDKVFPPEEVGKPAVKVEKIGDDK